MSSFVLDASALLALIQDEPGAGRVATRMPSAVLGSVNLTEVVTRLIVKGLTRQEIAAVLAEVDPVVHDHDRALAIEAGTMHALTGRRGLSLGDRACLALARHLGATALTADRAWAGLEVGVAIEVIR